MSTFFAYSIIAVVLVMAELAYFKIADKCNIIDKPNERSSHSTIVLRGGGVIFSISVMVWAIWKMVKGEGCMVDEYLPFIIGLILIAGVSFVDDVRSLPDSVRLVAQFGAMILLIWNIGMLQWSLWWAVPAALIVCVGAMNIVNFMDGINGITAGYAFAVLLPLLLLNREMGFIDESLLMVVLIGMLIFSSFNFRQKGRAKCFAGDVGSVGIAFILLFCIGKLVMQTGDVTWLVFLIVYGVDGCLTIIHRIMLHENLGLAHRKHAYQLMANELHISHVTVSIIYAVLQLVISLVAVYVIPHTAIAHWMYIIAAFAVLSAGYVLFMKKYYHLHEKYLSSIHNS